MNSIKHPSSRFFWLFLGFLLIASGCRSTRNVMKAPLKSADEMFLLEKMASAETRFDFYNARTNVTIINENKSKTELRGQVRIKKDSIIWISLSPALGIEAARLMLTTDSIKFISRLDKQYFVGDYQFIEEQFGTTIDFDMVQALITGNDLESYEDANFRASVDRSEYQLSATKRLKTRKSIKQKNDTPHVLVHNIWLQPETFKIVKIDLKEFNDETKKLEAAYSEFTEINGQYVPGRIDFKLHGGKNKLDLQLVFSKVELDTEQQFPFKIPDNYSKMK